MTNNSLRGRNSPLFTSIGALVIFGLILTACGATSTSGNTQPPTVFLLPSLTAPTAASPTVPAHIPTASSTASATITPPAFPDSAGYDWVPVVSGLNLPVDIQNAGDGSGRLFVVEKRGRILIIKDGHILPEPFLDIQNEVGSQHIEEGLLGLAFHPDYGKTGLFFVNYTNKNGNTVIARFHASSTEPNRADPASEVDILHVAQPYDNHNGGGLAFGPDGYLYIGLGDGGSEGDPLRNGQNLQTLLSKMLRIDINHGKLYTIPSNNPFANGGGLPEIWAYGLRNPWRFSFDKLTGDLYIADVGQDAWEEVDFVPAGSTGGLNFGWSYFEGMHPYNDQPPANVAFAQPVVEYSHSDGCSVTGGYVYHASVMPQWQGVYFYGDYCSGNIWGLIHTGENSWQSKLLFQTSAKITTFGLDEAGEIYLADIGTGMLLSLSPRQ